MNSIVMSINLFFIKFDANCKSKSISIFFLSSNFLFLSTISAQNVEKRFQSLTLTEVQALSIVDADVVRLFTITRIREIVKCHTQRVESIEFTCSMSKYKTLLHPKMRLFRKLSRSAQRVTTAIYIADFLQFCRWCGTRRHGRYVG